MHKDKYLKVYREVYSTLNGDSYMEVAKFLRALADLIDSAENSSQVKNDSGTEEVRSDETGTMVPPLQQEIELMKKMADVESIYDNTEEVNDEPETNNDTETPEVGSPSVNVENDELTILKKNAGLGLGLLDATLKGE